MKGIKLNAATKEEKVLVRGKITASLKSKLEIISKETEKKEEQLVEIALEYLVEKNKHLLKDIELKKEILNEIYEKEFEDELDEKELKKDEKEGIKNEFSKKI